MIFDHNLGEIHSFVDSEINGHELNNIFHIYLTKDTRPTYISQSMQVSHIDKPHPQTFSLNRQDRPTSNLYSINKGVEFQTIDI